MSKKLDKKVAGKPSDTSLNTKQNPKNTVQKSKPKREKLFVKLKRKFREVGSELKKVTWPKFSHVVKKTGVVIAIVVIFTLVLFGFDMLLQFLFGLLI